MRGRANFPGLPTYVLKGPKFKFIFVFHSIWEMDVTVATSYSLFFAAAAHTENFFLAPVPLLFSQKGEEGVYGSQMQNCFEKRSPILVPPRAPFVIDSHKPRFAKKKE